MLCCFDVIQQDIMTGTTFTQDVELVQELKKAALETGKPFKQIVNKALRAGLRGLAYPKPRTYRLWPVSLGYPVLGLFGSNFSLLVML